MISNDDSNKELVFEFNIGGDVDDIYKFNPFAGWEEWESTGIHTIRCVNDNTFF